MESTESSAGSALQHQPNLPPGFRFHPTDEELVVHYLKKKAVSAPLPVAIIAEVDLYKFDPWELPAKATFGEQEWYFFSPRDRKYPNGARPNRAATSGYWKATGTDKPVLSSGGTQKVGVKKALVFYGGKPPKGIKTNWIMHEYRLTDNKAASNRPPGCHDPANKKNSLRLDDWVLCRIYRKSNTSRPLDHHHHDHDHDHDHRHHHDSIVINDMLGGVGPVGNNQMSMMSVLGPQNIEKLQQPHQQLPKAAEAGISYDHHLFDGMLSSANNGSNTNNTNNANSLAASSSSAATKRGALPGMYWNVDVDEAAAAAGPSKRVLQLDHCHDSTTSTDHLAAAAAETASSSASLATLLSQLPPAAQTPPLHHHQQAAVLGAMGDGGLFQRHFQLPGMNWFS